jgi:hypothetical protein
MKTNADQPQLPAAMCAALERLYKVFKPYSAPKYPLDVCTHCCMDAAMELEMRRLPLRQLTTAHFYQYNDSAKSDPQPVDEIKYLLPRMLELLAAGSEIHHSTALQLSRLGNCESGAFLPAEYSAIDAFALAYFANGLGQHPWQSAGRYAVDDTFDALLMFDIGGVDLLPLLDNWLKDDSTAATLHYVSSGFYDFWQSQCVQDAFATDRPQFQEVLKTWLTDESNRRVFAARILNLDMSAIDQSTICYYGSQITPKEMAETVFDLITY